MSTVRTVHTALAWSALVLGVPLNGLAVWAILRHTPPVMRVYAKILLQTCAIDLLLLAATTVFVHMSLCLVKLVAEEWAMAYWNIGWLSARDPEDLAEVILGWLAGNVWLWLVNANLYSLLAQFVFRWLTLCRGRIFSSAQYLALFIGLQLVPLVWTGWVAWLDFPPHDHRTLRQEAADALGLLPVGQQLVFSAYFVAPNRLLSVLSLLMLAGAFVAIIVLGWLMRRHVRRGLRSVGASASTTTLRLQAQLTRTLVIQALLAATICVPSLVNVSASVLRVDPAGLFLYVLIPEYWPAVLDPLVLLLTISAYRQPTFGRLFSSFQSFSQEQSPAPTINVVQPQQQMASTTRPVPPPSVIG